MRGLHNLLSTITNRSLVYAASRAYIFVHFITILCFEYEMKP